MDDIQQEPLESVEDASATATEEPEAQVDENQQEPEEKAPLFNDEQQEIVDKIDAKWRRKSNKHRERVFELEREREELLAKIPQEVAPEIPHTPNPDDFYDDPEGFQKALRERDEAIVKRAEFDAVEKAKAEQQQKETLRQQQENHRKQQEQIATYEAAAESFNIDQAVMNEDANLLAGEGITADLFHHILGDPHGPLIARHLATNVSERDKVLQMSPMSAAAYIASTVKPNLSGARKTTQALKPASIVDGGGAPEKVHPSLKGGSYA